MRSGTSVLRILGAAAEKFNDLAALPEQGKQHGFSLIHRYGALPESGRRHISAREGMITLLIWALRLVIWIVLLPFRFIRWIVRTVRRRRKIKKGEYIDEEI